jgi:hypothetical protein
MTLAGHHERFGQGTDLDTDVQLSHRVTLRRVRDRVEDNIRTRMRRYQLSIPQQLAGTRRPGIPCGKRNRFLGLRGLNAPVGLDGKGPLGHNHPDLPARPVVLNASLDGEGRHVGDLEHRVPAS